MRNLLEQVLIASLLPKVLIAPFNSLAEEVVMDGRRSVVINIVQATSAAE